MSPHSSWVDKTRAVLERAGIKTHTASDLTAALAFIDEEWPDVVVIEERLLEIGGQSLITRLREGDWSPVILPTSLGPGSNESPYRALRAERELQRIEAIVFRLEGAFNIPGSLMIHLGDLSIDLARKEVTFQQRKVPLPPVQFRLLSYLALNAERVVDYRELVREVWGYQGSEGEARELLKNQIYLLRRKFGWHEESGTYLQSVRGFGYMLTAPQHSDH
ncbi:MAG: response regulator transcription factor [Candidatus Zipacnadales bacterium]